MSTDHSLLEVGAVGRLGKVADLLDARLLVGGLQAVYALLATRRLAAGTLSAVDSLVEAHVHCHLPAVEYLEGGKGIQFG